MSEQTDDDFLLYLIDMATIEASAKARSREDGLDFRLSQEETFLFRFRNRGRAG